jgi:hypothetical protein
MKKKKYIIISIVVVVILTLVFTGGVYVYIGPEYDYDYSFIVTEEGDGFIPRHFYLIYNVTEIPLIPVLLHVVRSKLPKGINISKKDVTYLERHKGFNSFKINKLALIFDNGQIVELISSENQEDGNLYQITEDWQDDLIFNDVVKEKSGFKYHIEGVSFSDNGTVHPFKYVVKYKYSYSFKFGTRFQEWASV